MIYKMLEGRTPFRGKNEKDVMDNILKTDAIIPSHFSEDLKDLLEKLLCKDGLKRLGSVNDADELKKHPFYSSINWTAIIKNRLIMPTLIPMKSLEEIEDISLDIVENDSIFSDHCNYFSSIS